MINCKEFSKELNELLQLDSRVIAVKRMGKKDGLMDIPGLEKPEGGGTYCQLPCWGRGGSVR